jgi:hypothetical protein
MSANDMKASNEAAVIQIEDAGKKVGVENERARIAGLQAAFPNDAVFVAEATKQGWNVTEAKAAKFDVVTAQNAELTKENEKLAKVAAEKDPNVTFASSDGENGKSASDNDGLSVDEKDVQSAELWNKSAQLRANFSGEKSAFQALYRHQKEMALEEVTKANAKK